MRLSIRPHRVAAEPVTCAGCGCRFRADFTGGRCPICDRPVDGFEAPRGLLGRVRGAFGEGWSAFVLVGALVGNIVIFVLVAIAASR